MIPLFCYNVPVLAVLYKFNRCLLIANGLSLSFLKNTGVPLRQLSISRHLTKTDSQGSRVDPGFFLGGGALVSCSTSTPINHIGFFVLQNTSCIRKPQVISGGGGGVRTPCTLPLDPPLGLVLKVSSLETVECNWLL